MVFKLNNNTPFSILGISSNNIKEVNSIIMITTIETNDIIHICMIGIGLVIAVYTLVYPKIEEIMNKQAKNVVRLEGKFTEKRKEYATNGLSKTNYDTLFKEIKLLRDKIEGEYTPPPELFFFIITTLALFSIPLIVISLDGLNISFLNFLYVGLPYFVFGGVLMLVLVSTLIFSRLHGLVMANFDNQVKTAQLEVGKEFKKLKKPTNILYGDDIEKLKKKHQD